MEDIASSCEQFAGRIPASDWKGCDLNHRSAASGQSVGSRSGGITFLYCSNAWRGDSECNALFSTIVIQKAIQREPFTLNFRNRRDSAFRASRRWLTGLGVIG